MFDVNTSDVRKRLTALMCVATQQTEKDKYNTIWQITTDLVGIDTQYYYDQKLKYFWEIRALSVQQVLNCTNLVP